jgi:microcystin-dependent protein
MPATPFIGQIAIVGFNFPPSGWALCNGQLLPISRYATLFSLIGTHYGGNGTSTFALPNLQGRVPIHQGKGPGLPDRVIGETGGREYFALTAAHLPAHTHALTGSTKTGGESLPGSSVVLGRSPKDKIYSKIAPDAALSTTSIGLTGGSTPISTVPPYLTINFIIALAGLFPSRS